MRDFEEWLGTFSDTLATWKYYTDFDKVYKKVNEVKVELNILNSLIGSLDIEKEFIDLVDRYPEVLKCIPILLAKRGTEVLIRDIEGKFDFNFNKLNYSVDDYVVFMYKTGLFDLFSMKKIKDVTDYITGVEVGLDSNARKNRTGTAMEDLVESYLVKAGLEKDVSYFKEMYKSEIESKWGYDLSSISNEGKTEKRFDFVVYVNSQVYAIEVNFYSGGGSKLNETARSYKTITLEAQEIDKFNFVWVTDGVGWNSAKNNLRETFDCLDALYNLNELANGSFNQLFGIQR